MKKVAAFLPMLHLKTENCFFQLIYLYKQNCWLGLAESQIKKPNQNNNKKTQHHHNKKFTIH